MGWGTTGGHYGEAIALTEIAKSHVCRLGDALDRGARFGRDVEKQDHI